MDVDMNDNIPTHAEIEAVEQAFDDVETELIRYQAKISASAYEQRAALIERIPHFWTVVFENPPEELSSALEIADTDAIGFLNKFHVERFELESSPRSFSLRFTFDENEWFEDKEIEKKFWYRSSLDGHSALVSEPVRIKWKEDQDLTKGFLDAAADLFDAEARERATSGKFFVDQAEREKLPEHAKLKKMLHDFEETMSFFTFFGHVSETRFITAEEAAAAKEKEKEKGDGAVEKKRKKSAAAAPGDNEEEEEAEEEGEEDLDEDNLLDVEICPWGAGLAAVLADDLWPNALKFYASAMEDDRVDLGGSDDDGDDGAEEDDDDDEEAPQLTKKRSASASAGSSAKVAKTGGA